MNDVLLVQSTGEEHEYGLQLLQSCKNMLVFSVHIGNTT